MNVSPEVQQLILHIVNVFETGSPLGNYGEVSLYHDGYDGSLQITYGRSQTTEQGNLRDLIRLYIHLGGLLSSEFQPWLDKIGLHPTVPGVWPKLARDPQFLDLLKRAGSDPIMHQAEDVFFNHDYFQPALAWANQNDFSLPLSLLVIYDSFIHSGTVPYFLRKRFAEEVPSQGGDEVNWTTDYVKTRDEWLTNYTDPAHPEKAALLRTSSYRTKCLLSQINIENWDLQKRPIPVNGVEVSS